MTADTHRIRYLSLDWLDALRAAVEADTQLGRLAGEHTIGLTQIISDGPEGTVVYHLQVAEGVARFGAGPADPEDVRMEQHWETAVAIATDRLNAEQAFISGKIRMTGNPLVVESALPLFAALDTVFRTVRERTDYE